MKKILTVIVVAACLWLSLFQGTSKSPLRDNLSVPSASVDSAREIVSSLPILYFSVFVVVLYFLHLILRWWFYDRGNFVGDVKIIEKED